MNKTLEDMYTGLLQEHDTIQASNPWGCNQYGHRKGHQGGSSPSSSGGSESVKTLSEAKEKLNKLNKKIEDSDKQRQEKIWGDDKDESKKATDESNELSRLSVDTFREISVLEETKKNPSERDMITLNDKLNKMEQILKNGLDY
jgi:hypothetical protein